MGRGERACEYFSDLILRSALFARVSKDGREYMRCGYPSRRLLRKLLRMRSTFLHNLVRRDDVAAAHLQFDHIKIALGGAAFRTNPIHGNVDPSRARSEAFVGVAFGLVIDVAAGPALPGFSGLGAHRDFPSCGEILSDRVWASSG